MESPAQNGSSKKGYLLACGTDLVLGTAGFGDSSSVIRTQFLAISPVYFPLC